MKGGQRGRKREGKELGQAAGARKRRKKGGGEG